LDWERSHSYIEGEQSQKKKLNSQQKAAVYFWYMRSKSGSYPLGNLFSFFSFGASFFTSVLIFLESILSISFCRSSSLSSSERSASTVVTWELEKMDNNKTRLKLLHTGLKPDETAKIHNEGWSHFLGQLSKYCSKNT
jgi:hypothetical protein